MPLAVVTVAAQPGGCEPSFDTAQTTADVAEQIMEQMRPGEDPEHGFEPGSDYRDELEFGLELVIDGLERATSNRPPDP